jgi:hypothetical protein
MPDDLSLDFGTVTEQLKEKPEGDAWLARRELTFGASDVPALLMGYFRDDYSIRAPRYLEDKARPHNFADGTYPRIVLEKAGARKAQKGNSATRAGQKRERELLLTWKRSIPSQPFEEMIDVDSIRHADAAPKEWFRAWPSPPTPGAGT